MDLDLLTISTIRVQKLFSGVAWDIMKSHHLNSRGMHSLTELILQLISTGVIPSLEWLIQKMLKCKKNLFKDYPKKEWKYFQVKDLRNLLPKPSKSRPEREDSYMHHISKVGIILKSGNSKLRIIIINMAEKMLKCSIWVKVTVHQEKIQIPTVLKGLVEHMKSKAQLS